MSETKRKSERVVVQRGEYQALRYYRKRLAYIEQAIFADAAHLRAMARRALEHGRTKERRGA